MKKIASDIEKDNKMEDWEIVKNNALRELELKSVIPSFIQQRLYQIESVKDDRIIVRRLSGGKAAAFKKHEVISAIESLKVHNRIKKDELLRSVVREVMLVHLHPFVEWDHKTQEIFWIPLKAKLTMNNLESLIHEAPDDQLERVHGLILKRRNQSKFRKALMNLYGGKCAISKCKVEIVLEAAHISKYSASGLNSNINGIILRNDLHTLFDNNFLLIHPIHLTIQLHPQLQNSEYWHFNGLAISDRHDGSSIKSKYLEERWESADWNKK